ncbi:hypothetical protein [Alienimonas chondri]|uniref:DUF3618 domain-containing protein n=1 Tax=Alienimonas chondri TaxID=2681879 RepID=A0ABX1VK60_9PLAN|nr:hypothetical protein [Alienimonas chondri]NNJ28099.1 hypothetical protein [Alienimonas chondri]
MSAPPSPARRSPVRPPAPAPPRLVAEVAALRSEVRGLGAEVRTLGGEVRRMGRTDWPAVLTAGGLAATVLAGLGTLALDPLKAEAARSGTAVDAVRGEVHALADEVRDHTLHGHPAADARLNALERRARP